jgi:hypothetical protein
MRVRDPVGVEWEVTRRRLAGLTWVVEASSERGELSWSVRGGRRARHAQQEVENALERGERAFTPKRAKRLLRDSPLSSYERSNVRILPSRER